MNETLFYLLFLELGAAVFVKYCELYHVIVLLVCAIVSRIRNGKQIKEE